jgi:hypothetical protein
LAYRAPGDPELVFVVAMCDIAQGLLPGPFDAADACRYVLGPRTDVLAWNAAATAMLGERVCPMKCVSSW